MEAVFVYLRSTIGRKVIMGLSGLGMSAFVLGHMAGNLLIFAGAETFNRYGHAIVSNKILLYGTEAFLLLCFVAHGVTAIWLTRDNKQARGRGYALSSSTEKAASLASRSMIYSGFLIGAFVITHLITFKYGNYYEVQYGGESMRDLHRLMIEVFQNPAYVAWYLVALLLLALHLSHGIYSSFQSLGFVHPSYTPTIQWVSKIYALVVGLGFISQPLYVYFWSTL